MHGAVCVCVIWKVYSHLNSMIFYVWAALVTVSQVFPMRAWALACADCERDMEMRSNSMETLFTHTISIYVVYSNENEKNTPWTE